MEAKPLSRQTLPSVQAFLVLQASLAGLVGLLVLADLALRQNQTCLAYPSAHSDPGGQAGQEHPLDQVGLGSQQNQWHLVDPVTCRCRCGMYMYVHVSNALSVCLLTLSPGCPGDPGGPGLPVGPCVACGKGLNHSHALYHTSHTVPRLASPVHHHLHLFHPHQVDQANPTHRDRNHTG